MDAVAQLGVLTHLAREWGIEVRHVPLDGAGGGLCVVRGRRVLFVDTTADPATRLERTARALAQLPEIDTRFIRPDIRDLLERYRRGG
ncbi:MAG: hypothetical protein V2A79_04075 [Planctomycetota bacterium]